MSKKSEGSGLGSLGKWIIIATVLGAVVGLVMGKEAHALAPIGDLFMTLIKMVVVPMVFFSLVGGAASLGNSKSAGKIGAVTFIYYGLTTAVAVGLGLLASELAKPGVGINMSAISEAMNQMCGSIATSMASLLRQPTDIGFPLINCTEQKTFEIPEELCNGNDIVKVSFRLIVDDIIDSRLVQLYPVSIVKQILKQEEI